MAEEVGLLSLPDEILAKIACKTEQSDDVERLGQWAIASTTCRRLSELQLSGFPIIKSWKSKASPYLLRLNLTPSNPMWCT